MPPRRAELLAFQAPATIPPENEEGRRSGDLVEQTFRVDAAVEEIVFALVNLPENTRHGFTLIAPEGTLVDPAGAEASPDVEYVAGGDLGYALYLVRKPAPGTWIARHRAGLGEASVIAPVVSPVSLDVVFEPSAEATSEGEVVRAEASGLSGCAARVIEATIFRVQDDGSLVAAGQVPMSVGAADVATASFTLSEPGEYAVRAFLSCELAGEVVHREAWASAVVDDPARGWSGDGSAAASLSTPPSEVTLAQNYPNPFRTQTTVRFAVPASGPVSLRLYDVLGREVAVLHEGETSAGWHEVEFRAPLAAGVYFLRLDADGVVETRRVIVVR